MNQLLNNALDCGISEQEYYSMTPAEITRRIESKNRQIEEQQKTTAIFDYLQAGIIGTYIAKMFNSNINIPTIESAYPFLFEQPKQEEQPEQDINAIRFIQWAAAINKAKGVSK